jgi:aryl-alcohol dehydrogenase-like predicted oxidoreductase
VLVTDIDETVTALTDLTQQGKFGYIGHSTFSCHRKTQTRRAPKIQKLPRRGTASV